MKKTLILTFLVATSILMANCSHKMHSTKSNPNADKVAAVKAKYSSAQIEQGKGIFESHCNKCHKLYDPQEFPIDKWEGVLPPMSKKAHLSDDEAALVRAYVLSNVKVG